MSSLNNQGLVANLITISINPHRVFTHFTSFIEQ